MRKQNNHGDLERRFLGWVSDVENHTATPEFSFVARECDGGYFMLVKGVLSLNRVVPLTCPDTFQMENIRAGHFFIGHGELENFCAELLSGVIRRGGMELRVVDMDTQGVEDIKFILHDDGGGFQYNRASIYQLIGHDHGLDLGGLTDWALKGANPPYDSLADLLSDYQLGAIVARSTVDVAEFLVIGISAESAISGDRAQVVVGLVAGLDPSEASIGFRAIAPDRSVRHRGVITSTEIAWECLDKQTKGVVEIGVHLGDVLNCYACYRQRAQNQSWVVDSANTQNPLRSAYEVFDPGLGKLSIWLAGKGGKKQNDFELGVSILAWLLGFSSMHFEREIITDSPDILLWGANAVLVIECTIGPFGSDKVAKLTGREEGIRRRLSESGHPGVTLKCLFVSSLKGSDAEASRRAAHNQGVGFVDGDSLFNLLQRTVIFPRPDSLIRELLNAVPADDPDVGGGGR